MAQTLDSLLDLLLKYDGAVPRYTSYPPATLFTQDPEKADYEGLLRTSNHTGSRNISLYIHVPFCVRRCLFCGCHTEIGRTGSIIREYLEALMCEFQLLLPYLDRSRPVTQIHFGGGTPNSVPSSSLSDLLNLISTTLNVSPSAEIAMECDPALVLPPKLEELRRMGINRLSFGIQDVNTQVLDAVGRKPSRMPHPELVKISRELGFSGINLDLIYGLPFQTPESFRKTVNAILEADPDRISLFPYAHVPWIKGHQAELQKFPTPDSRTRLLIAAESRDALLRGGYVAIGMDHFAKPGDDLAVAQSEGNLHRNFQGYCSAVRAGQVYALGASGISQLQQGYLQNEKDIGQYQAGIKNGRLPIRTAYRMTPQDSAVRSIINALLCQGSVNLHQALSMPDLEPEWKTGYRMRSSSHLSPYIADGLVKEENGVVSITEKGMPLARMVAGAFDPLLNRATTTSRYSRAI